MNSDTNESYNEAVKQESHILPEVKDDFSYGELFSGKNLIIVILCVLLVFSFLGINLLDILSNLIKKIVALFAPLIAQILSVLGFTTGTVLNAGADVVADTGKFALDVAEGTVQSVGNVMIKASKGNMNMDAKSDLNNVFKTNNVDLSLPKFDKPPPSYSVPKNDVSENPIQKPISADKRQWCLVGEYDNKRKCIDIAEHDKCMSGQVFPNEKMCLNPNITP